MKKKLSRLFRPGLMACLLVMLGFAAATLLLKQYPLAIAEFVVTMLVANLASIPMQDGAIPLYSGLVPILTVLGLELVRQSYQQA